MHLSENIRRLRVELGLSQEELGEKVGVSRQAVSKWEAGVTAPDISLLPALARFLNVTIDGLFAVPAQRYGGYGSRRGELFALCQRENAGEEDFHRAAEAYREVIVNGTATAEDYVYYGMLHHMRASRDIQIALRYYRRTISEFDAQRDVHWMLAHTEQLNLMKMLGRTEEMLDEFTLWTEREPGSCWAHVQRSHVLMLLSRLDEAYEAIQCALSLDPDDMNAQTMAGDLCARLGEFDEAIPHWDRAYELDPTCISCWFSKAEAYVSMGNPQSAIAQYKQILSWLESRGYDMQLEGAYPLQRIHDLSGGQCPHPIAAAQ